MREHLDASREKMARAVRALAQRLRLADAGAGMDATLERLRAVLPLRPAAGRDNTPYRVAQDDTGQPARPAPGAGPGPPPRSRTRLDAVAAWFAGLRRPFTRSSQSPATPRGGPALSRRRPASGAPPASSQGNSRQASAQPASARPGSGTTWAHARPDAARGGSTPPSRQPARSQWLTAHGLVKSYGGRTVVNGITLGLRRGEVVGLLGPNGAGKTTTFYMITGLINADAGAIELDGFDVTHLPMYRRARLGVGYLPQEASIFRGLSVEQNIMAVLELVERDRSARERQLDSLLEEFSISKVRKSPSIALSGGERRRVEIARALASRPVFMLLDEPFAGIDPIAVNDIRVLVRHLTQRGIGVLITDHNVRETLGLIDRAYIIHDGKVLMEGTPQAVVDNDAVRQHYLGEDFSL